MCVRIFLEIVISGRGLKMEPMQILHELETVFDWLKQYEIHIFLLNISPMNHRSGFTILALDISLRVENL